MANSQFAKVTSKGQVVIPKAIRDEFGIKTGSHIEFANENDRLVLKVTDEFETLDALISKAKGQISPKSANFGDDEIIKDNWSGKPVSEYASTYDFLKEWNAQYD